MIKDKKTKVISFINLKGGVGKTTTTVGLGTFLSGVYNKKVLIIDLDPQTNCTVMLIGEEKWSEINQKGYTLYSLFNDALKETTNFDINKSIQKDVSNISDVKGLDLISSSIDMIDLQDELLTAPQGDFYSSIPTEILMRSLYSINDEYDYILIDCPPNMGLITLNGLRISDGYIIPTIPDILSTYGIDQIINRISKYSRNLYRNIICLGIVFTKFREQSGLHRNTVSQLKKLKKADVFNTIFKENSKIAEAAEFQSFSTLKQKWGYDGQYDLFNQFTKEVLSLME